MVDHGTKETHHHSHVHVSSDFVGDLLRHSLGLKSKVGNRKIERPYKVRRGANSIKGESGALINTSAPNLLPMNNRVSNK